MKQYLRNGSLIPLFVIVCVTACKKSAGPESQNTVVNGQHDTTLAVTTQVPFPVSPLQECNNAPFYGDSIVYPQPGSSGDFFVYPQNNQGVTGTYYSWPAGLDMDAKTGSIDLTKSETGQRYAVAFVKSGTTDTCMSSLIVAGVAYEDSVYVLSENANTAKPYFNANPNVPSPCQTNQGEGCKFDYNNFAQNQGIVIDQHTGNIDLQKTMQKSPFGLLPINGTTVYTTIYYKLADQSNNAAQQIQLKMVYYNHKSDVPVPTLLTVTDNLLNTVNNIILSQGPTTRPPLIVIVRNN